jgi:hypothetical protein
MPLFMEITCEASYPVAEGVTAGFLGMMINLGATAFLSVELIPNVGRYDNECFLLFL